MGSIQEHNRQKYCPVLLKIANEDLLELEKKKYNDTVAKPYILQVWTNKGVMIYERRMETSVRGWCMKDNFLLFEEFKDNVITISILRCYDDRSGRIKSIVLPTDSAINTEFLSRGLSKRSRTFGSIF